jgi:glycerate kinase
VKFLANRLAATAERYQQRFGVDVTRVPGSGAAGGLAGGLHALGATLVPGFDVVADEVGLYDAVSECDVIITGEGRLDSTSFDGKVVGGVAALAYKHGKSVAAICGDVAPEAKALALKNHLDAMSLRDLFGDDAFSATTGCIEQAAARWLSSRYA